MTKLKTILAAGAALAALGTAQQAHATAYAYATINFSNLSLVGLTSPGVSTSGANVVTSSSAGYDGFPAASNTAGPANTANPLAGGSDVVQSYSGPGPAPAQNVYTPALTASSGTRGDAILSGNINNAASAADVAEGRLTIPGAGNSTGGTTTGFNVTVQTTSTQTFTLSFNAGDTLTTQTTLANEVASAQVSASFSVLVDSGAIISQTGGGTSGVFAPTALNTGLTSVTPTTTARNVTNPSAFYTYSVTLAPGTYEFSLLSGAQERVTSPAAVPEPASLALIGAGLLAMGVVRRKRT